MYIYSKKYPIVVVKQIDSLEKLLVKIKKDFKKLLSMLLDM